MERSDQRKLGSLHRWILASVILTYGLIVLGGLVSATNSGMGCGPQWPICNDQVIPIFDNMATVLEYLHRVMAGMVVLAILGTVLQARRVGAGPLLRLMMGLVLALVVGQSILGAVTVWLHIPPTVSTVHLLISQIIMALTVAALVWTSFQQADPTTQIATGTRAKTRRLMFLSTAAGITTLAVMVIGGAVKLHGAGLACGPEIPLCWGSASPLGLEGTVLLHWIHRAGALIAGLLIIGLHAATWSDPKLEPILRRSTSAAVILLFVQIALGLFTVLSRLDSGLSTAHLAVGTFLFSSLIYIVAILAVKSGFPAAVSGPVIEG